MNADRLIVGRIVKAYFEGELVVFCRLNPKTAICYELGSANGCETLGGWRKATPSPASHIEVSQRESPGRGRLGLDGRKAGCRGVGNAFQMAA